MRVRPKTTSRAFRTPFGRAHPQSAAPLHSSLDFAGAVNGAVNFVNRKRYNRQMTAPSSRVDKNFLARQKRRLTELRQQILEVRRGEESAESSANADTRAQAREY